MRGQNTIWYESIIGTASFQVKSQILERKQTFGRMRFVAKKVDDRTIVSQDGGDGKSVRNFSRIIANETQSGNGMRTEVLVWRMVNSGLWEKDFT